MALGTIGDQFGIIERSSKVQTAAETAGRQVLLCGKWEGSGKWKVRSGRFQVPYSEYCGLDLQSCNYPCLPNLEGLSTWWAEQCRAGI